MNVDKTGGNRVRLYREVEVLIDVVVNTLVGLVLLLLLSSDGRQRKQQIGPAGGGGGWWWPVVTLIVVVVTFEFLLALKISSFF